MPINRGTPPPTARALLGRVAAGTPRWVVVAICGVLAASAAGAIGLAVHGRESQDAATRIEAAASASARSAAAPSPTATASASASASVAAATSAPTPSPASTASQTPRTTPPAPAPLPAAVPAAKPRPNPCPLDPPYTGPIFVTSTPSATGNGSNGHLPTSTLTWLPAWANDTMGTPQYLLKAAGAALNRLNDAFEARFDASTDIDLTYRSYPDQVAIRAALGSIAAKPGTSLHGIRNALDVQEWSCIYGFGTEKRDWLVANAPTYSWVSPSWAREGADNPEYWHYEYVR